MNRLSVRLFVVLALLMTLTLVNGPRAAHASTIWTVESTGDGPANPSNCPGPGCRLRDAIAAALPGDTIQLPVLGTIVLDGSSLSIYSTNLTIEGPGSGALTINAAAASRVFDIFLSTVSMSGLTLTGGTANILTYTSNFTGGAMLIQGGSHVTLDQMIISDNAVDCATQCVGPADGTGGAIASFTDSSLTITNSSIRGNTATFFGGGIYFNSGTANGDVLTLSHVLIANNQAPGNNGMGGGIMVDGAYSTSLSSTGFLGNQSEAGGGLAVQSGIVRMDESTFSDNIASGVPGTGGAVYFADLDAVPTDMRITNSTLMANTAGSVGGGIYSASGYTAVFNSTFQGNTSLIGGGISTTGTAGLLVNSVTLSGNSATIRGGALGLLGGSPIDVMDTIMANSAGSDCTSNVPWATNQGNLIQTNDASAPCPPPAQSGDPLLGPLTTSNGGTTAMMALQAGSPAIDGGSTAGGCPVSDQRGILRPQGLQCDIGAYEYIDPTVERVFPSDGAQACLQPQIGLELRISDLTRKNGSFDPTIVNLSLDGTSVFSAARIEQTLDYPASLATIMWTPPSPLAAGAHVAMFNYPMAGGTAFRLWAFTAANIACALSGPQLPALTGPGAINPPPPQVPSRPGGGASGTPGSP